MKPPLPNPSSEAYLWYCQGAADQEAKQIAGLGPAAKEIIGVIRSFGSLEMNRGLSRRQIITTLAQTYCPHILRRRYRNEQ